jgi:adenosylhomocysteinase
MRIEQNPEHDKASAFFRRILSAADASQTSDVCVIAVIHLVDSAMAFLPEVDEKFSVLGYLGKPSSMQDEARNYLRAALQNREFLLNRSEIRSNPKKVLSEILPKVSSDEAPRLLLLDIGGYFAPSAKEEDPHHFERLEEIVRERGYRLIGIVEDTENGHARYKEALERIVPASAPFPVYSVAKSPLKKPENHLVGVAITFSIEAILRQSNIVLQSRRAGVIGFGPIGRSVAHSLRGRGIPVSICEVDSVKLAQAAAQGFTVFSYEHGFETFASSLNLIVSATGAAASGLDHPIGPSTVGYIRPGTFVASVTSRDDEIDLEGIESDGVFHPTPVAFNEDLVHWRKDDETGFYVMLNGNAVNFRDGGVVGPAIRLLQGEILQCMLSAINASSSSGDGRDLETARILELNDLQRKNLADAWLDHYLIDEEFAN